MKNIDTDSNSNIYADDLKSFLVFFYHRCTCKFFFFFNLYCWINTFELIQVSEEVRTKEMSPHGSVFTESRSNHTDGAIKTAAAGETVSHCAMAQK